MSCFGVTVEYFKALFARDFPYLPQYQYGKIYFINDVVYYNNNFYKSLVDNNTAEPSDANNWQAISDNESNYIQDSDIERAFEEAASTFNGGFFDDCSTAGMYFCYVAAHYLVIDINNALNGLAISFNGFVQSKSVGSVSESYGIPQWIMNNPTYALLAQTGYGRKYLLYIIPIARAKSLILTPGRTTIG